MAIPPLGPAQGQALTNPRAEASSHPSTLVAGQVTKGGLWLDLRADAPAGATRQVRRRYLAS
ncbi:hypothetical protein GCM10027422_43660 [Hymenobacter arcticus]